MHPTKLIWYVYICVVLHQILVIEPSFVSPPPSMETESNNILHISEDSNLNFDIVWDDRPSITTPNSSE